MKVVARSTPNTTVGHVRHRRLKISTDWKPQGRVRASAPWPSCSRARSRARSAAASRTASTLPAESKDKSRLLVVSASQFLANPFARAGNPPPMPPQMAMMGGMGGDEDLQMISQPYAQKYLTATILAFKNMLDWMGGDSRPHRGEREAPRRAEPHLLGHPQAEERGDGRRGVAQEEGGGVQAERKRVQQKVQWTLTFLGPALFAAFGIAPLAPARERARETIGLD